LAASLAYFSAKANNFPYNSDYFSNVSYASASCNALYLGKKINFLIFKFSTSFDAAS